MTTLHQPHTLAAAEVRRDLSLRDLTDPERGHHAMQDLLDEVVADVGAGTRVLRRRGNPVVAVTDNYDRLGYPPDAVARDARYSRYLTPDLMLRAHTTAVVPPVLEELAGTARAEPPDVLLVCPGLVYRRDVIDRQHVGEPHQLDLWRVRLGPGAGLDVADLDALVGRVVRAALPGRRWRTVPAEHPYTLAGRQVDVETPDGWVEVGECGLAHPDVLARSGLARGTTALASGWGLDRLLMLRKGIEDIRLLRSTDPRVAAQLHDLGPYVPVSAMPATVRDLSLAVDAPPDAELLGDRVRALLGDDAAVVESVEVVSVTPAGALPPAARDRLGIGDGQHNLLLRLVVRALDRTLTAREANEVRDRVYAGLHRGRRWTWADGSDTPPVGERPDG